MACCCSCGVSMQQLRLVAGLRCGNACPFDMYCACTYVNSFISSASYGVASGEPSTVCGCNKSTALLCSSAARSVACTTGTQVPLSRGIPSLPIIHVL